MDVRRDEHGHPQFSSPVGKMLSPRALHALRCFLLGIRREDLVQQAWDELQAAKRAADKSPKGKGKRRRGR